MKDLCQYFHSLYEKAHQRYSQKEYLDYLFVETLAINEAFEDYKNSCSCQIDVAKINIRVDGYTVLMEVVEVGNLELIKFLVEAGADVNIVTGEGYPLYLAAEHGWEDIFNYLFPLTQKELRKSATKQLNKGKKYRRQRNRYLTEILVSGAKSGNIEQLKIAIALGVDVNSVNSKNEAAIHQASCQGEVDIVQALLDAGANPNLKVKGKTPAIQATFYGELEVLKTLVEAGADMNIYTQQLDTPLQIAKVKGYREIVDYLLPLTRIEKEMNKSYSWLIGELFDAIEEEQNPKKIRELIETGVDINVPVEEGCTPLIAAVLIGNFDIVKLLVELGADVNVLDENFDSALFYAKYNKFQDIAEYLEPITSPEVRSDVEKHIEYLKKNLEKF